MRFAVPEDDRCPDCTSERMCADCQETVDIGMEVVRGILARQRLKRRPVCDRCGHTAHPDAACNHPFMPANLRDAQCGCDAYVPFNPALR